MNSAYNNLIKLIGQAEMIGDSQRLQSPPPVKRRPGPGGKNFAEMFEEMVNRVAERGLTPVGFSRADYWDSKVDTFKVRRRDRSVYDSDDNYQPARNPYRGNGACVYSRSVKDNRRSAVIEQASVRDRQTDDAPLIIDHSDYIVLDDDEVPR